MSPPLRYFLTAHGPQLHFAACQDSVPAPKPTWSFHSPGPAKWPYTFAFISSAALVNLMVLIPGQRAEYCPPGPQGAPEGWAGGEKTKAREELHWEVRAQNLAATHSRGSVQESTQHAKPGWTFFSYDAKMNSTAPRPSDPRPDTNSYNACASHHILCYLWSLLYFSLKHTH